MNAPALLILTLALAASPTAESGSGWRGQAAGTGWSFYPAYFQPDNPPRLRVFPPDGPEVAVALPEGLPTDSRAITFAGDGEGLYLQRTEPLNRSIGIDKVEFDPARYSSVPGSIGTGEVGCLAVSRTSGRITISGWSWAHNSGGIFEIDSSAGTSQPLPLGEASLCGGEGGLLSPDGKRAITADGRWLALITLKTGAIARIGRTSTDMRCSWSPDGGWIAAVRDGRITLIDADDAARSRSLGASGDAPVVWSPDSKYLLLRRSSLSCALAVYGERLEIIDVERGTRKPVRSSECKITAGRFGWLDKNLVH